MLVFLNWTLNEQTGLAGEASLLWWINTLLLKSLKYDPGYHLNLERRGLSDVRSMEELLNGQQFPIEAGKIRLWPSFGISLTKKLRLRPWQQVCVGRWVGSTKYGGVVEWGAVCHWSHPKVTLPVVAPTTTPTMQRLRHYWQSIA